MNRLFVRAVRSCVLVFLLFSSALAADVLADDPVLPQVPAAWRITLHHAAVEVWGLNAPTARFAAQIHAESSWRPTAQSPYAMGLAQFTPSTAKYMAELYPHLRPAAPWDAGWSKRALITYDKHLFDRERGWRSDADRWAATLTSYVGGGGWVRRERRAAAAAGDDPDRWWHGVEAHCLRSVIACRESRHYSRRILCELEPAYIRAGWPSGGGAICNGAINE